MGYSAFHRVQSKATSQAGSNPNDRFYLSNPQMPWSTMWLFTLCRLTIPVILN